MLVPDEPELESLPVVREVPVPELPVLPVELEPIPEPLDPVLPDEVPDPVP